MKEILALIAVLGGFISIWVANDYASQISQPNKFKRHATSAATASIGAGFLLWLVSPSDGASEMGWGWVLLALLTSVFLAAVAVASPAALKKVRAEHGLDQAKPWEGDKPQPLSEEQRKALNLQERAPSEVARMPSAQPKSKPKQPARQTVITATPATDDRFAHLCPEPVDSRAVAFLYENAEGEISDRTVDVDWVGTSHFAGFCRRELDERTFRFDRIIGMATLTDTGEKVLPGELRDLLRGYDEQELRRRKRAAAKTCSEILFTGFKKDRRAELEDIAQAAGMVVRKNVTTNLDFLCAGSNAGQTKLAEALERGVTVLDEQQLLRMLATGEVPA